MKEGFGRSRLINIIGGLFWRSTKCLFNLTTGRTASVTMIKLLNLSPAVDAFHEPKPRLREASKAAYADIREQPEKYASLFSAARRGPIGITGLKGRIYVEHTVMASLSPLIANELPEARFMHMHRHPAGVIRSGIHRGWYQGHSWDRYRVEPLPDDPVREQWDTEWDPFAKICWNWHFVNDYILRFRETIANERTLPVRFESFVDVETGDYARPFEFLGLEPPSIDLAREVLGVRHNAQIEGDFPSYEQWSDEQRRILYRIAGETMQRLGYE